MMFCILPSAKKAAELCNGFPFLAVFFVGSPTIAAIPLQCFEIFSVAFWHLSIKSSNSRKSRGGYPETASSAKTTISAFSFCAFSMA